MSRGRVILIAVIGAVLTFLAIPVCMVASAFIGNVPLEDGRTFADGKVITVVDGYVSCFLVDTEDGGWALIDACQDPEARAIRAALEARGAGLADVRAVFLTHSHGDHIGGLAALGDAAVFGVAEAVPLLAGEAAHLGPIPALMGEVDTGFALTEVVADGEERAVGDAVITAYAVPGHTADSAAFLVHGVLFLGDNATLKSGGMKGAPWVFSDDQATNRASLQSLHERLAPLADRVQWLVPAHTGPAVGLAALGDVPRG